MIRQSKGKTEGSIWVREEIYVLREAEKEKKILWDSLILLIILGQIGGTPPTGQVDTSSSYVTC